MIGLMPLAQYAHHNPTEMVALKASNGPGWYIQSLGGRALEYHSTKAECVAVLKNNGYEPFGKSLWKKM